MKKLLFLALSLAAPLAFAYTVKYDYEFKNGDHRICQYDDNGRDYVVEVPLAKSCPAEVERKSD